MTPDLEDRILSLFAHGFGWEDAAAIIARNEIASGRAAEDADMSQLRTSVQNLWREYVSGKDKA